MLTLWHISIWFDECGAVVLKSSLHGQLGENPQLWIFLYKLCFLLRLMMDMLFVFDGPRWLPRKCDQDVVQNQGLWIDRYAKELIEMFGFAWHAVRHPSSPGISTTWTHIVIQARHLVKLRLNLWSSIAMATLMQL